MDSIFIIGGRVDYQNSATIARFNGQIWSLAGNLKYGRQLASAISHGSQTLIVGGIATAAL